MTGKQKFKEVAKDLAKGLVGIEISYHPNSEEIYEMRFVLELGKSFTLKANGNTIEIIVPEVTKV